jgi:hypothetical protein
MKNHCSDKPMIPGIFFKICEEIVDGGVKVMHTETGVLGSYAYKNTDWVSFDASFLIQKKVGIHKLHTDVSIYGIKIG